MSERADDAPKLSPCPFCGGKAFVDAPVSRAPVSGQPPRRYYVVRCSGCPAIVETVTKKRLEMLWNRRSTNARLAARVERLEKALLLADYLIDRIVCDDRELSGHRIIGTESMIDADRRAYDACRAVLTAAREVER